MGHRITSYNVCYTKLLRTLYKQYTELCSPGGVIFLDFNVDQDFGNCVDGLVVVDIHQLKANKRKRYIEGALAGMER